MASAGAVGQTTELLQLELIPEKAEYAAGELPNFEVVIKNVSAQEVRLCTYMLDYRLKAAMIARNRERGQRSYELQPFLSADWLPLKESDFTTLTPGQELRHRLTLSGDERFGWIQRHSQPPVVSPNFVIKGFPAGSYAFETALSDQVGLYVGRDGVFDHQLEGKKVPGELAGGQAHSEVYSRLLEGGVTITFR